jgi:hypothetical protein
VPFEFPPNPDFTSADDVELVLRAGADANRTARCRVGSIDRAEAPGRLIATGDLHDNPMHLAKLTSLAGLDEGSDDPQRRAHLTLHEIIHGDRLTNGMDFSFRVMAKVAHLKARHPEHVHVLLGNHELAQMQRAGILKDGVKSVEVFRAGVEYVFGGESERIESAIEDFVRSMPLALRCSTPRGDFLCAHSLPPAASMSRFDTGIISREATDADYEPRRGPVHLMVWGRGYDAEGLEDLVEAWGVYMFILGHEKSPNGAHFVAPNAIVLASDHERGTFLPIDLSEPPSPEQAMQAVRWLAEA